MSAIDAYNKSLDNKIQKTKAVPKKTVQCDISKSNEVANDVNDIYSYFNSEN